MVLKWGVVNAEPKRYFFFDSAFESIKENSAFEGHEEDEVEIVPQVVFLFDVVEKPPVLVDGLPVQTANEANVAIVFINDAFPVP